MHTLDRAALTAQLAEDAELAVNLEGHLDLDQVMQSAFGSR